MKIDWKSKFIDLLIVTIGITIAFKLNTWNESKKLDIEVKEYVHGFLEENELNEAKLIGALDFSTTSKLNIDTLKQMLISGNYDNDRAKTLSASMMAMAAFSPSTTTMDNITASGEFKLIKDVELRKHLVDTYKSFENTHLLEKVLSDYLNTFVTPYYFNNVRFSDFSSINENFTEETKFENIVIGFEILLTQKIKGYQQSLELVKELDEVLEVAVE